jgi:FlaG/FlaF family flagellin (archaellin)
MKTKRKSKEQIESAVSAVIGVILMVAITVAVASTLYVYVSGMIGGEKDHTANIGCLVDSSTDRITITSAEMPIQWKDIAVVTDNATVNWTVYDTNGNPLDVAKSTSGALTEVGAGDYIELDFTANPGMTGNVRVTLRYVPTNTLLGSWIITV